ncbi:hypothetical protein JCM18916_971 [Cutibacterium acnes JCM 18916]|nr:hypothetical protein JCM18916_971 [Cutibacterium acnes JCM 18916]
MPGGQGLGYRFVIGAHVINDLIDDDPEPVSAFSGVPASHDSEGNSTHVAMNSASSGDQVTWKL